MFDLHYYALKILITADGSVTGRKRFQKLAYILQRFDFPLPEHFVYHHYGPYSSGLNAIMFELSRSDFISEKTVSEEKVYDVTRAGENFVRTLEENHLVNKYETPGYIKSITQLVKSQDPSLLELISTVLFLEEYGEPSSIDNAIELKPHLRSYAPVAKELLDKIRLLGCRDQHISSSPYVLGASS